MRLPRRVIQQFAGVVATQVLLLASVRTGAGLPARAAGLDPQADISPEASPEIRQVKPKEGMIGTEVMLEIEGKNFSPGVYVSFSHPAVRVLSSRRISDTKLETRVAVAPKAQAGTLVLFVSNPAGTVAETAFVVKGGASGETPLAPAPPPSRGPTAPATPVAPQPETDSRPPSEPPGPEVSTVNPSSAGRGSQATLKVTGKNFAPGAKVAFSNPGIRVLETVVEKSTELRAQIQVASEAPTGPTGLFVVNPDDTETEVQFQVTAEAPGSSPAPAPATPSPAAAAESLRFEVMNLGEVSSIFQTRERPKGTLTFAGGKLRYEEAGKEVFVVTAAEIKEVQVNSFAGINTGTFHVLLSSGQNFNFIAASLKPADSQSIVDALRRALQ
jgi:hypothetical protein